MATADNSNSNNINVEVTAQHEGQPVEVILRRGHAAEIHEEKNLIYAGRLDACQQFLSRKLTYYKPEDSTLVIDKNENTVTFHGNEWDTPKDTVTGKLDLNPELEAFKINGEKLWGFTELFNFLKARAYFFPDKEGHKTLLHNLRNFQVKVQNVHENRADNSGNKKVSYERIIDGNPLGGATFKLEIPLYKGYEAMVFPVEMAFDATDAGVQVFLLSEELYTLLRTERDRLMGQEETYFREWAARSSPSRNPPLPRKQKTPLGTKPVGSDFTNISLQ